MLANVWEYTVREERLADFETLYREEGPWVQLFRRAAGFESTTVWRDMTHPERVLIVDRWRDAEAWDAFMRDHAAEYEALSQQGAPMYRGEHLVGRFTTL
jgi:heme-degrading monooxygenase HmoA